MPTNGKAEAPHLGPTHSLRPGNCIADQGKREPPAVETTTDRNRSTARGDNSALVTPDIVMPIQRTPSEPRTVSSRRREPRPPTVDSARAAWISEALGGVRKLAATGRPFQCHDLVLLCDVPEPPDHHQWGSLMSLARSEGIVVSVAATPSSRPRTAKSLCRLWVGVAHAQCAGEE